LLQTTGYASRQSVFLCPKLPMASLAAQFFEPKMQKKLCHCGKTKKFQKNIRKNWLKMRLATQPLIDFYTR
jgi:hypothetical protein